MVSHIKYISLMWHRNSPFQDPKGLSNVDMTKQTFKGFICKIKNKSSFAGSSDTSFGAISFDAGRGVEPGVRKT